jgi:hypothetical protein
MNQPSRRRAVLLVAAALLLPWPGAAARAAMLGDAALSYSAQRTVTVNGRSYSGMVFHIPGHERHEQEIAGISEVILLDVATKQGALIVPELNAYISFPFPPLMAELDDPALRRKAVGEETVNGMRTTKYRIEHQAADGSRAEGFAWVSREGVLMRLEGMFLRAGAEKGVTVRMELAGLQPGPQDQGLFAVPPGLVKLPAGALQAFLTGRPAEH